MLKCHELFGFMSPSLSQEILNFAYSSDKALYRAVLAAVADSRKLRTAFFEKRPRTERHQEMLASLSRPRLEEASANLLRSWLLKSEQALLIDFLDQLGIAHEKGVVNEFPKTVDDARLTATVDFLLGKYPAEKVAVYLNTISATSGTNWANLETLLQTEPRVQLG